MKTIRQYRIRFLGRVRWHTDNDFMELKTEWRFLNGKTIEDLQKEIKNYDDKKGISGDFYLNKNARIEYREIVVNKALKRTRDFKKWNEHQWKLGRA